MKRESFLFKLRKQAVNNVYQKFYRKNVTMTAFIFCYLPRFMQGFAREKVIILDVTFQSFPGSAKFVKAL